MNNINLLITFVYTFVCARRCMALMKVNNRLQS